MNEIVIESLGNNTFRKEGQEFSVDPSKKETLVVFLMMTGLFFVLPNYFESLQRQGIKISSGADQIAVQAIEETRIQAQAVTHPFEVYNPAIRRLVELMAATPGTYRFPQGNRSFL